MSQPNLAVLPCRAFALLSGFILHSSSPAIVDCLLCLLEERFSEQESQGATSFVHTQERIASYHWLLTVFCDAISSVIPAQRSDFLSMERCRRVSKGIVNLIIHLVASSNPSSGETVLIGCKVCSYYYCCLHLPTVTLPYCHCHSTVNVILLSLPQPPYCHSSILALSSYFHCHHLLDVSPPNVTVTLLSLSSYCHYHSLSTVTLPY